MCNHSYAATPAKTPAQATSKRCPYPELYAKMGASSAAGDGAPPDLPVDQTGVCIFHSTAVAWKRENDFKNRFLRLVELLNANQALKSFDFSEFVLVGAEIATPAGARQHVLGIEDATFLREANFTKATFVDGFTLERVNFKQGADFREATFTSDLRVTQTQFNGLSFTRARVRERALFTNVAFDSYAWFDRSEFTGASPGHVVKFQDSRFEGVTTFCDVAFALGAESSVAFLQVRFDEGADFGKAQFRSQVIFSDASFAGTTEFIDTSFGIVTSSARYRGCAVEFNQIEVKEGAVLVFASTDPQNKIFEHDVQMSFKDEPAGVIRFENVNFSKIGSVSKARLLRLAKLGRVEIGSGCIKYRHQTELKTLPVARDNAPLIIELCQTFTNYFTASNGLNLGFEIVDRGETELSFFYFTDEDISGAEFLVRLARTERGLWSMLSTRSDLQLLAPELPAGKSLSTVKQSAIINAVDGVSATIGTFFRVAIRIALGTWKQADTKALLSAIRTQEEDDEEAERRARSLHLVLSENYTYKTLSAFNTTQNGRLLHAVRRLPHDAIATLLHAAIGAGLDRGALLAGINPQFTAQLPSAPSPGSQLYQDLQELNAVAQLADGCDPLKQWLRTAALLTAPRTESAIFEKYLAEI